MGFRFVNVLLKISDDENDDKGFRLDLKMIFFLQKIVMAETLIFMKKSMDLYLLKKR